MDVISEPTRLYRQFRHIPRLTEMLERNNVRFTNPIEKHFDAISKYQYYIFTVLFISNLPICWHILHLIFLNPPIDYYCNDTEASIDLSDLGNECPCDNPLWNRSVFTETIQTKFNLLCAKEWLIGFSEYMAYSGTLIGALVFGFFSDRFGRLTCFSSSCLILAVSGCLVSVMPSIGIYIFTIFIEGIGIGACIVTLFVLTVEFSGYRYREIVTGLYHIPIALGHTSLAGVSYLLRNCDDFQLALSIPIFVLIGMKWLSMESPRWLMDNGHVQEASNIVEKLSKFNGVSSSEIKSEIEAYQSSLSSKIKIWEIFKHKQLTVNLLCMSFIYLVCGLGYYGISIFIGRKSDNVHLNVSVSGAFLLPGAVASVFLLKILNRRTLLFSSMLMSGVFMFLLIYVPSTTNMTSTKIVVACICNSFFFTSFTVALLFGVEIYPTSIRNSVLGYLTALSRIGQIVAPLISEFSEKSACLILGGLAIIAAVLSIPLPEPKNMELPSSLEECKFLSNKGYTGIKEAIALKDN